MAIKGTYYLVCPKCMRVMAAYFIYCGGIFGRCGTRHEDGVWVHEARTRVDPEKGGSGNRYAVTLRGALPYNEL